MKRILTIICCLTLLLGIVPFCVSASETASQNMQTVEYLEDGSYIVTELEVTPAVARTARSYTKKSTYYTASNTAVFAVSLTGNFNYTYNVSCTATSQKYFLYQFMQTPHPLYQKHLSPYHFCANAVYWHRQSFLFGKNTFSFCKHYLAVIRLTFLNLHTRFHSNPILKAATFSWKQPPFFFNILISINTQRLQQKPAYSETGRFYLVAFIIPAPRRPFHAPCRTVPQCPRGCGSRAKSSFLVP